MSKKDDILTEEQVFLETICKTQAEAFQKIAAVAKKLGFLKEDASEKFLVSIVVFSIEKKKELLLLVVVLLYHMLVMKILLNQEFSLCALNNQCHEKH